MVAAVGIPVPEPGIGRLPMTVIGTVDDMFDSVAGAGLAVSG